MVLVDAIWELSWVQGVGDGAGKVEQARVWGVLNAVKVTLFYAVKKNLLSYYGPDSMLSAGKEMTSQVPVFKTCTVEQRICKCADKWVSQSVMSVRTAIWGATQWSHEGSVMQRRIFPGRYYGGDQKSRTFELESKMEGLSFRKKMQVRVGNWLEGREPSQRGNSRQGKD